MPLLRPKLPWRRLFLSACRSLISQLGLRPPTPSCARLRPPPPPGPSPRLRLVPLLRRARPARPPAVRPDKAQVLMRSIDSKLRIFFKWKGISWRQWTIICLLQDAVLTDLTQFVWWFKSMAARKANLKLFVPKVCKAGASVVKATEFVQGQTARWGLAGSFIAPRKMVVKSITPGKVQHSFMLQKTALQSGKALLREYLSVFRYVKQQSVCYPSGDPEGVRRGGVVPAADRMRPENVGLSSDPKVFRTRYAAEGTPTITHTTIYKCENFSMVILFLLPIATIPLHNQPGMTVFSKLILGSMHIKSYAWVDSDPAVSGCSSPDHQY